MKRQMTAIAVACALAGGYASIHAVQAADTTGAAVTNQDQQAQSGSDERARARQLINDAAGTLKAMKSDPEISGMLRDAKAIFVVSNKGADAFVNGGKGGEGVLVARERMWWSLDAIRSHAGDTYCPRPSNRRSKHCSSNRRGISSEASALSSGWR